MMRAGYPVAHNKMTKDIHKVLYVGDTKVYTLRGNEQLGPVFIEVTYKEGKMSMHGVEAPRANGNAWGSAGQIVDSLDAIEQYAEGWDAESVQKLKEYWKRYHLNDMRAECEHQRNIAEFCEPAKSEIVYTYIWRLKPEYSEQKRNLEREAIERAASTESTALGFSPEEKRLLRAEQFITTPKDTLEGYNAKYYEPTKDTTGYFAHVKSAARHWTSYEEDPRGLLGKPCPVCGYKYGSAWKHLDVPERVLAWISALPESKRVPAWV